MLLESFNLLAEDTVDNNAFVGGREVPTQEAKKDLGGQDPNYLIVCPATSCLLV